MRRFEWTPEIEVDAHADIWWRTAQGRRLRIRDMTDGHLRNCIFWLQKQYGFTICAMGEKLDWRVRPDGTAPGPQDVRPDVYRALIAEANRRNLPWG